MNYSETLPCSDLAPYIKCYWSLEGDAPLVGDGERILPDGCMEMIFHYGSPFINYTDGKNEVQDRAFIYGQLTRFISIGPSGSMGIFAVRFRPGGLAAFSKFQANEIVQSTISINDAFGTSLGELTDKILSAMSFEQRVELVQHFLQTRLMGPTIQHQIVQDSIQRIVCAKGNFRVSELAEAYRVSTRQFERIFGTVVGLSPKAFGRILRFRYTTSLFPTIQDLTTLAYESGYYDQSHFIRDFRDIAGQTPGEYFSGVHPMDNLITG